MGDDQTAPIVPDYGGACLSNVVPLLLERPDDTPAWMPPSALDADRVVLLVLDGLGWEQMQTRRASDADAVIDGRRSRSSRSCRRRRPPP